MVDKLAAVIAILASILMHQTWLNLIQSTQSKLSPRLSGLLTLAILLLGLFVYATVHKDR